MSKQGWRWQLGPLLIVVLVTTIGVVPALAVPQDDIGLSEDAETVAVYDDRIIDMAKDWEGAGACLVWPEAIDTPECFDTEKQMNRRIAELEKLTGNIQSAAVVGGGPEARGTSCSGYLRLYDGTSYTGAVLYLRGRYQWFDLVSFNFNQKTSSFKIGPCSAYFADYAAGGGDWYPTSQTQAYDVAATMVSGWNNDVSSVYIT